MFAELDQTGLAAEYLGKGFFNRITNAVNVPSNEMQYNSSNSSRDLNYEYKLYRQTSKYERTSVYSHYCQNKIIRKFDAVSL